MIAFLSSNADPFDTWLDPPQITGANGNLHNTRHI